MNKSSKVSIKYAAIGCLACLLIGEAFAQNEQASVADSPHPSEGVIVFATSAANTPPLADVQDEKLTGGILKQLGDAIAIELHRKALYVVLPRKRLVMELEKGMVDGVCYYRPEWLEAKLNWSPPLIPNEILLVGREGLPAPKKLEDIKGKTIGMVLGYKYPELDVINGNYRRDDAITMTGNIKKLGLGRDDYAVVDRLSLDYSRKSEPGLRKISILPITKISASCGFSSVSKIPFNDIDDAIQKIIKQGTVRSILAGYR